MHTIYSTDYSELLEYIQSGWNEEFDSLINIKHYDGDEATSCKSKFSLTSNGIEYLNNHRIPKMHVFTIITTTLALIIAFLTLMISIF